VNYPKVQDVLGGGSMLDDLPKAEQERMLQMGQQGVNACEVFVGQLKRFDIESDAWLNEVGLGLGLGSDSRLNKVHNGNTLSHSRIRPYPT